MSLSARTWGRQFCDLPLRILTESIFFAHLWIIHWVWNSGFEYIFPQTFFFIIPFSSCNLYLWLSFPGKSVSSLWKFCEFFPYPKCSEVCLSFIGMNWCCFSLCPIEYSYWAHLVWYLLQRHSSLLSFVRCLPSIPSGVFSISYVTDTITSWPIPHILRSSFILFMTLFSNRIWSPVSVPLKLPCA